MSIKSYLSLIKFSHTIFALPFAVIGYFLAVTQTGAEFSITLFALVVLCMVFARSAAMAFNRYIDRKFDQKNQRTAIREIPAGIIAPQHALVFVVVNCILFIVTTWFINPLCFYLSPVALLVVLGYSFTKRFTALCHLVLGVGLALAPIGSYLAVTGRFDWLPLMFSFAVLCWVSGFDIIYALQDDEFDRSENLRSIPVWMGRKGALLLSTALHVLCATFIVAAGLSGDFNFWYWIGATVFGGLLVYQHSIVRPDDLSRVNLAFGTTNGVASVIFACFVLLSLFT